MAMSYAPKELLGAVDYNIRLLWLRARGGRGEGVRAGETMFYA